MIFIVSEVIAIDNWSKPVFIKLQKIQTFTFPDIKG